MEDDNKVTYFGETDARNRRLKFGIKQKDRSRHTYVIGKTGMGKSTVLENMAIQDIRDGNGLAFIDPHGKTADLLLEYIPQERINDVLYFAPFDMEYPVSFNVMEDVGPERRHLVSAGLMSAFKKIWVDAWSARMEYILGNIMLALLEYPGSTLIGINRMLADKDYRKKIVDNITDPSVRSFWVDEYAKYTDKFAAEAAPAIQNKVGQFVANPIVRNIIGQPKSTFDLRKIMDEKKILIINLSKGKMGESNANLLGSMLITKIYLAAMSRADLKEKELEAVPNFYLYVDEFQSFANESFADILSEARKYKLNLTIAHQYIEQMSDEVRAAVFGNVGTMITFRVGAYDAEVLEKEYAPQFTAEDVVNLQKYQMYLKLMIDGVSSPPFSANGMAPYPRPDVTYTKDIIDASRKNFARPRYEVEDEIRKWHEPEPSSGGGGAKKPGANYGGGNSTSSAPRPFTPSSTTPRSDGPRQTPTPILTTAPSQSNVSTQPPRSPQSSPSTTPSQSPRPQSAPSQSQPRPSSRPPEENSSKPNAKEKENRETNLRNAISLSYLKTEPEVKNDQKSAKPENVAALRDALLSVMKEAQVEIPPQLAKPQGKTEAKSETPTTSSVQQPLTKPDVEPEKPKEEPKKEAPQPPPQQKQSFGQTAAFQSDIRGSQFVKKGPAEVPEEILKKILDTDN